MTRREIRLPICDIVVVVTEDGGGSVTSTLGVPTNHPDYDPEFQAGLSVLYSMLMGHVIAGIDITTPAYLEGIDHAVNALFNEFT